MFEQSNDLTRDANMAVMYRGMVAVNNMGVSLLLNGSGESTRAAIQNFKESLMFVKVADQHLHDQLQTPLSTMSIEEAVKSANAHMFRYSARCTPVEPSLVERCSSAKIGYVSLQAGQAIMIQDGQFSTSSSTLITTPLRIELEDFGTLNPTDRDLEFITVILLYNLGIACLKLARIMASNRSAEHRLADASIGSAIKVLRLAQSMLCSIEFNLYQELDDGDGLSCNETCCFQLESCILQNMIPALQFNSQMEEAMACSQRLDELIQLVDEAVALMNILPIVGAGAA